MGNHPSGALADALAVCGVALGLAACSSAQNRIEVDTADAANVSGVVILCGRQADLVTQGERLRATMPATCEGSGEVRLRLEDGRVVTCPVGYVTPGAGQTFLFVLNGEECASVSSRR